MNKLGIHICSRDFRSHALAALGANALVVELHLVDKVAFNLDGGRHGGSRLVHEIHHLSTFLAIEVNVRMGVAVVANPVLVDGNHQGGLALGEEPQRVIDRGATQRPNLRTERCIYFFNGGMREVCHQIIHDLYPLYRRFYAAIQ